MSKGKLLHDPSKDLPGQNYANMDAEGKSRIDELFKKYPLKPVDIDVNVKGKDILEQLSGDDSKRILTKLIVAHQNPQATDQEVIKYFLKDIEVHGWEMGYEIDYDFPRHLRAIRVKNRPFTWTIFAVLKKDRYNKRDLYFGEKGQSLAEAGKIMQQRQQQRKIDKTQDFTKIG